MSISLTPRATARVRDYLARQGGAVGLRLGVRRTGCSGLTYTVESADAVREDDVVMNVDGLQLIVAAEHLPILDGARIDYVRDGLNEKFAFENPNATGQCGCGESFSVR
ncbi:MAG: iron-sulfur cluster assembly accessory protein [Gammaproteobacteria bacterium]|nr:iron-sulfur cluster assembly accessory protein [Gammaproteobacteria bacterium]